MRLSKGLFLTGKWEKTSLKGRKLSQALKNKQGLRMRLDLREEVAKALAIRTKHVWRWVIFVWLSLES